MWNFTILMVHYLRIGHIGVVHFFEVHYCGSKLTCYKSYTVTSGLPYLRCLNPTLEKTQPIEISYTTAVKNQDLS